MIEMKKFNFKKNLLLFLVGIFMFSIFSDVKAETLNNIVDYKIKEFKIYVYNDEGLSDVNGFKEQEGVNVITIKPEDINYKLKDAKVYDIDNYKLIEVPIKIENMEKILEEKILSLSDKLSGGTDEKYYCTLSVVYDLNRLPDDANKVYDYDYENVFSGNQDETDIKNPTNLHQMLVSVIYDKNNLNNHFDYDGKMNYKVKYITVPQGEREITYSIRAHGKEIPIFDQYSFYSGDKFVRGNEKYRFMLHDDEYFIAKDENNNTNNSNDNIIETPVDKNPTKIQKINNVPDTGVNKNIVTFVVGSTLLIFGCLIIRKTRSS